MYFKKRLKILVTLTNSNKLQINLKMSLNVKDSNSHNNLLQDRLAQLDTF